MTGECFRGVLIRFLLMAASVVFVFADDGKKDFMPPSPPSLAEGVLSGQPGQGNSFDRGLAHYLRQEYKQAISELTVAVDAGLETEKAKRILKRAYVEMIRSRGLAGDLSGAEEFRSRARRIFPQDGDFVDGSKSASDQPREKPKIKSVKNKDYSPAQSESASIKKETPVRNLEVSLAPKTDLAIEPIRKVDAAESVLTRWELAGAVFVMVVLIAGAAGMMNWRLKRSMNEQMVKSKLVLEEQAANLELAVRKLQTEKDRLLTDVLAQQKNLELLIIQQNKPPTVTRPAPKPLPSEEDRRRLREQAQRLEIKARQEIKGVSTEKIKSSSSDPEKPLKKEDKKIAAVEIKIQKKQILESLVHIGPQDRPELQQRIASQANALCQSSPSEGIKFLRQLSHDESPLVRVMVVPALIEVRLPLAWDMVFELAADADSEVRAQVLKSLKLALQEPSLKEDIHRRIQNLFDEEKNKAEWVF